LQFPDLCPFTDSPAPRGIVRLKETKTLFVIPLPGAIYNRYRTTQIRIPASQEIAKKALRLEVLIWASLLGGIAIGLLTVLLTEHSPTPQSWPFLPLIAGPILALVFRIQRYFLLRRVCIGKTGPEALELCFQSETYAKTFSELNHLPLTVN